MVRYGIMYQMGESSLDRGLESVGGGISPVVALRMWILGYIGDVERQSVEEKQENFQKSITSLADPRYTIAVAQYLEQMKGEGEILEWRCVPPMPAWTNSKLILSSRQKMAFTFLYKLPRRLCAGTRGEIR